MREKVPSALEIDVPVEVAQEILRNAILHRRQGILRVAQEPEPVPIGPEGEEVREHGVFYTSLSNLIELALGDERHAIATYDAILEPMDENDPNRLAFEEILRDEQDHEKILIRMLGAKISPRRAQAEEEFLSKLLDDYLITEGIEEVLAEGLQYGTVSPAEVSTANLRMVAMLQQMVESLRGIEGGEGIADYIVTSLEAYNDEPDPGQQSAILQMANSAIHDLLYEKELIRRKPSWWSYSFAPERPWKEGLPETEAALFEELLLRFSEDEGLGAIEGAVEKFRSC